MTPKVSIIVAAYNSETFIGECLRNLMRQTYDNIELIIVDDGSTDQTGAIVDSFAASVKVIHQPNKGVSAARNMGLNVATGDFVLFCDADDEYHPKAVETMVNSIAGDVDMVAGQISYEPFKSENLFIKRKNVLSGTETAINTLYQKRGFNNSVCGKLLRRSLFEEISLFKEGIRFEDLEISMRLLAKARKAVILDAPLYFYRQHDSSFMHQWSPQRLDSLKVAESLLKEAEQYGVKMEKAARSRLFSAAFNLYLLAKKYNCRDVAEHCKKILREGRRAALTDSDVRFKNKIGALMAYFII